MTPNLDWKVRNGWERDFPISCCEKGRRRSPSNEEGNVETGKLRGKGKKT